MFARLDQVIHHITGMEQSASVKFLSETPISSLGKLTKIFHVKSSSTAAEAMKVLVDNNILCAPILDEKKNQYIGFIDMMDIVSFIVALYEENELLKEDLETLLDQGSRFASTSVVDMADFSHKNPFVPVRDTASLFELFKILGQYGVHRVPVINESGKIVNLATQSMVVNFLVGNIDNLGDKMNKTVGELGVGSDNVISVGLEDPCINAFHIMSEKKISAVAVVDAEGNLVTPISVKDIRTLANDAGKIHRLFFPVRKFLTLMHDNDVNIMTPSVSCRSDSLLKDVILNLATTRVHRVYVLDEGKPTKVISLTDVLDAFC